MVRRERSELPAFCYEDGRILCATRLRVDPIQLNHHGQRVFIVARCRFPCAACDWKLLCLGAEQAAKTRGCLSVETPVLRRGSQARNDPQESGGLPSSKGCG